MAILMRKANLISNQKMQLLNNMQGKIDVYCTPMVPGAYPNEVVFVNNARSVSVSLDYEDLDFKFECFFFTINPFSKDLGMKVESITVRDVFYLFRCEWKSSEENEKNAVFGRGRVDEIPDDSMVCCSDVGFLMQSVDGIRMLVYSNDDFPLSVGVTKDDAFIDEYIGSCDMVFSKEVSQFSKGLLTKGFDINSI